MIYPDWPAPANVLAVSTTRQAPAGAAVASCGGYAEFNLASHVGDAPAAVAANRGVLVEQFGADVHAVQWLNQVHGVEVFCAGGGVGGVPDADAVICREPGQAVAVLTADCLPVLFCDRDGREVAAAHAGWRGLCNGVLVNTISAFKAPPAQLMAWLGPAISSRHFEVGAEVRADFLGRFTGPESSCVDRAFVPCAGAPDKYLADLYQLARLQLKSLGVDAIYGGGHCTVSDETLFYSYRRQPRCGRQASVIALRAGGYF